MCPAPKTTFNTPGLPLEAPAPIRTHERGSVMHKVLPKASKASHAPLKLQFLIQLNSPYLQTDLCDMSKVWVTL